MIKRFNQHINESMKDFKYLDYIQVLLDKYENNELFDKPYYRGNSGVDFGFKIGSTTEDLKKYTSLLSDFLNEFDVIIETMKHDELDYRIDTGSVSEGVYIRLQVYEKVNSTSINFDYLESKLEDHFNVGITFNKEVKRTKKIIPMEHGENLIFDLSKHPIYNLIITADFYGAHDENLDISQLIDYLHNLLPNFNLENVTDDDYKKIRVSLKK